MFFCKKNALFRLIIWQFRKKAVSLHAFSRFDVLTRAYIQAVRWREGGSFRKTNKFKLT